MNRQIILLFWITMVSCNFKYMTDPLDPELPKYTEEGSDVGGAYINQEAWITVSKYGTHTSSIDPYLEINNSRDSVILRFNGNINFSRYTEVEFCLRGLNIRKFRDLAQLKDKKIALDGIINEGVLRASTVKAGGIGQLYIKNVNFTDSINVILSGTFGFTVYDNMESTEVSYGRFDFTFTEYYRIENGGSFFCIKMP